MPYVKKGTMNIKFIYRQGLDFSQREQDFLFNESNNFGLVEIKKYSSRSGALDLVSIIETGVTFIVLTNIQAFTKGFIGEDWFKNLGEKARKELEQEMILAKGFINAYFDVFVRNNSNKREAYVISENIGDVTLYVVINHYDMTSQLLDKLPNALVDTYGKICLGYISVESKTCQLFPDFENNEWRYLFTPTYQGFGNFVDDYYDFKSNKHIKINSRQDFVDRFDLVDDDKYKLIIHPLID